MADANGSVRVSALVSNVGNVAGDDVVQLYATTPEAGRAAAADRSGWRASANAQRVFFPAGARLDPQLTVSLSDQSLAGYQTLGHSTPLPRRHDGQLPQQPAGRGPGGHGNQLSTARAGVATVTATVRYHGKQATGQFVVYVR